MHSFEYIWDIFGILWDRKEINLRSFEHMRRSYLECLGTERTIGHETEVAI